MAGARSRHTEARPPGVHEDHARLPGLLPFLSIGATFVIILPRCRLRDLRAVFRRAALGLPHRGPAPPLILSADPDVGLRVRFHHAPLAVETVVPGTFRLAETILTPLEILAEAGGRDDAPVVFERADSGRTVVRWDDRSIPQTRELAVPDAGSLPAFPTAPARLEAAPVTLLDALAEAAQVTADDATRFDLRNLRLGGRGGEVAATDGHQLLLRRVGPLPWDDDVLVRRTPLFAGKGLSRDRPIALGRTDSHVVLRAGPWTLWLTIQAEARFPRLDGAIPADLDRATRLSLDPADAAFLASALDRLPGGDNEHAPVTLDLNGHVAVRARGDGPPTELVLGRSSYSGEPLRLNTDRGYLGRALALGLRELAIVAPDRPVVARDSERTYAWQPLSADAALGPSGDAVRIESTAMTPAREAVAYPEPVRNSMPENMPHHRPPGAKNPAAGEPSSAGGLAALVREAEELHATLADAKGRAARLAAGLRRHRKQSRLVNQTIRSLRELKLAGVAD